MKKSKLIVIIIIILVVITSAILGVHLIRKYTKYNKINNNVEKIKINGKEVEVPPTIESKPIIYLYPTDEMNVSIKLENNEKIICSYPKYNSNGWNVVAYPNGDLLDVDTNKNLYALYYESENSLDFGIKDEGFIVKGEDSAKFLEEKLSILGLTEREAEEFIIYWLPKLESNNYNYIRFATNEDINQNMPLEINPNPDTLIRVLMLYKGIDEPITVKEQELKKVDRSGFVAVEWGGTELIDF